MSGVKLSKKDHILEIVIDRPKANAIDRQTSYDLADAFITLRDDQDLRVGIITGAGEKIFSAGWDLKAAAEGREYEAMDYGPGGFAGLDILFSLNKPLIAAVNGIAVGGGVEIALGCDLIVAAENATFSLPETSLGVMADAGGVQRLPRRLPRNIAMDLLLTGRKMSAQEAAAWGLVNTVVRLPELMDTARALATRIAEAAPLSVMAIKEVLRGIQGMTDGEAFKAVRSGQFPIYQAMLTSSDHEEGPRAYMEKRKPQWRGR